MTHVKLQNLEQSYAAEFNTNYVKRHCKFNFQNIDTHMLYWKSDFFCPHLYKVRLILGFKHN